MSALTQEERERLARIDLHGCIGERSSMCAVCFTVALVRRLAERVEVLTQERDHQCFWCCPVPEEGFWNEQEQRVDYCEHEEVDMSVCLRPETFCHAWIKRESGGAG